MFCKVPTDAVIFGVTSRKAGATSVNGASTMGGTLLWITGFLNSLIKISDFNQLKTLVARNELLIIGI